MTRPSPVSYEYPRPAVTADTVLWVVTANKMESPKVLLIQRRNEPFQGQWALPGGFVDQGESLEEAARREVQEETGVTIDQLWPVGGYGDPGRDPRGWTVTMAFQSVQLEERVASQSGDDASAVELHTIDQLPRLAFDHDRIIADALERLRRDVYTLPIVAPVLPPTFTVSELHSLISRFDPETPSLEDFQRRMLDGKMVEPVAGSGGRWRFRKALSQG